MFYTASACLVAGSVGWKEEAWELSHHLGKDAKEMTRGFTLVRIFQ